MAPGTSRDAPTLLQSGEGTIERFVGEAASPRCPWLSRDTKTPSLAGSHSAATGARALEGADLLDLVARSHPWRRPANSFRIARGFGSARRRRGDFNFRIDKMVLSISATASQ